VTNFSLTDLLDFSVASIDAENTSIGLGPGVRKWLVVHI